MEKNTMPTVNMAVTGDDLGVFALSGIRHLQCLKEIL